MSTKCDNCSKTITKTAPGVECGKCERIVHLATKCTGLNNKQIAALKAAPSLEWTCLECQAETPRRSSSIIIPDDECEEDEPNVQINANKLLSKISKEVEKALKKEMKELHESLQFNSSKLDDVVQCLDEFKKSIKSLERKNIELTNKNKNLETRVGAMEQRIQELEQEKMISSLEVANVPAESNEQAKQVVNNIAKKINQTLDGIKSTQRLQGKKDQPPKLLVVLQDEETRDRWVAAAKSIKTTVSDIHPTIANNNNSVFIREAMTNYNKHLLWNAKQELKVKNNFKFVWFKRGFVKARKDENEKIYTIRTIDDLQSITSKYS